MGVRHIVRKKKPIRTSAKQVQPIIQSSPIERKPQPKPRKKKNIEPFKVEKK